MDPSLSPSRHSDCSVYFIFWYDFTWGKLLLPGPTGLHTAVATVSEQLRTRTCGGRAAGARAAARAARAARRGKTVGPRQRGRTARRGKTVGPRQRGRMGRTSQEPTCSSGA